LKTTKHSYSGSSEEYPTLTKNYFNSTIYNVATTFENQEYSGLITSGNIYYTAFCLYATQDEQ